MAPESVIKGKLLPLVIAFYGAGGSENMFFDQLAAEVTDSNVAAPAER
ncbi:MAG: hypothetical protein ACOX1P_04115 [Thermoguttaceae bacterium]|jgi:hypothetical protein